MTNKERSASDMLHYIEEIESLSKLTIQEFEIAYPAVESDINFHLIALKGCAYGISSEIDKVHHDRVGIESSLPDDPPTDGIKEAV